MLNVQNISLDSGFVVKINGFMPKLSDDLEHEVECLWQAEQSRRGKEIFNGRIMSASTVSDVGVDGYIVEYRHLIAQRAQPELFETLQVRPVAVSGLFECADGIVFGRRAGCMTQDAGLWELVPSGGIDTSKIKNDVTIVSLDFCSQLLAELSQEVGIDSGCISSVKPFCLVDDTDSHVLDIGIVIESPLSASYLLKAHQENATKEYEELRVVLQSEISGFIKHEALSLVKVSEELLRLYCAQ